MNSIQNYKKRLYSKFSDNFYIKKAKVDLIADNSRFIRRPYKAKVKELAMFAFGVESLCAVVFGFGSCFWIATGAFAMAKTANYQLPLILTANLLANFMCDWFKVKVLYTKYEDTIIGVMIDYSFENDSRYKLIYGN